ncbi:MAG: two pore domain potassium channel family protein [Phycisphaerales bacterium]|nr:two pore domain potassium channel family protein [Phycisphaerales bacterium]
MHRLLKPSSPWRLLKNRTLPLLLALVALVALHPLFTVDGNLAANYFPLAIVTVPLIGVATIGSVRRALPLLVIMIAIVVWGWVAYDFDTSTIGRSGIPYLLMAYYAYAIVALAHQLLRKAALQDDRLYGGLAIYLLIALMFTTVHRHISLICQDAYIETTDGTTVPFHWNDALYFSFSTITTLGFGDIVPRAAWARTATIIEVVLGVFITVGFVAQLVAASVRLTLGGGDAPRTPAKR